ncbi:MAG: hypothetical protein Q8P17_01175 [bacterium]|nr:hypothetical protein [bacterium]
MGARHLELFFIITALVWNAVPFVAYAETVTVYTQADDSGDIASQQPNFQNTYISTDIGNLALGKDVLTITFTMKDPNASDTYGQPEGVALGTCTTCNDLQKYLFTSADRTLLADGAFHTFTVQTGTTTLDSADGTVPIYINFFGLSQYQNSTHLKSNASSTTPTLTITTPEPPPPPDIPAPPSGSVAVYTQSDNIAVMTNPQTTFQNAFVDSASLGNLNLGTDKVYITFTIKDPNASNVYGTPTGVCIQENSSTDCGSRLQTYLFTDADRTLLSDGSYHTFTVETGTTTSTYADGTRPVSVGFFGLSQYQYGTRIKSNSAQTIPYLTIYTPPPPPPEYSNVLFLPGIEGSRLYMKENGEERPLWEPNTNSDISLLAMTSDGASVSTIYTRDVIDKIWGWHTDIYDGFSNFMDSLIASSTVGLKEWKAYPYDWRYDVFDVVDNGSLKGDGSREYLKDVVEQMASSSPTGKVTLLAHSNGGLLAKALMVRLAQIGKENLVDKIIFVASPQVGTPKALFSLLHGYDQDYGLGFIGNPVTVRTVSKNFPGIYGLLPSLAYFGEILSPLANFTDDSTVKAYRKLFGATLDSYDELSKFILNVPKTRNMPKPDDLATPLPLNKKLVDKAVATHALIDAWQPPSGVTVSEIVGWGNETISTANYQDATTLNCIQGSVICKTKKYLNYQTVNVIDGDETVISASASYLNKAVYFNLAELNKGFFTKNYDHAVLLSSSVLDSYIQKLLTNSSSTSTAPYFSSTTPSGKGRRLVLVGAHSPVLISATDSSGRTTGIFPSPNTGSDLLIIKKEIPDSSVLFAGEGKYISLPEDAPVTIQLVGTGSGTVTLDTTDADGEVLSSYENIPVVTGSIIETTIQNGVAGTVELDMDGDGTVDMQTSGTFTVADTLALLKERIAGVSSLVVRNRLVGLYRQAERYARDIRRAGRMLIDMEKIVRSQSGRTVPRADSDAILILIQNLKNRR